MAGVGGFLYVTIDAEDPDRLAAFRAALPRHRDDLVMDDGRYVFLKGSSSIPVLCLQRVPEPKTRKNRVHLDLSVDDLDAATVEVEHLGGSWPNRNQRQLEDFEWRTLADPEGNKFDIATGG